jgi:sporulation protein YlmC with PRC-barrel domain
MTVAGFKVWPLHEEHVMTTLDPGVQPATGGSGATIVGGGTGEGPGPDVMAAATLGGDKVITSDGEDIGKISDIMLDVRGGRIAYAVLSSGGFLGMGNTLYAIPWSALTLDTGEKCFRLDIAAERIKNAPGFDKDHWPAMADEQWGSSLHEYYNQRPYWLAFKSLKRGTSVSVAVEPTGHLRHLFETPAGRLAFSSHQQLPKELRETGYWR